jgi:hypothetical protein
MMKKTLLSFAALVTLCAAPLLIPRHASAQGTCYALDTWANMCAGTSAGPYFQASDGPLHAVYGASGWQALFTDVPVTPPVNNSVFTGAPTFFWVNQSNATEKDLGGCVYIEAPKASFTYGNQNLYAQTVSRPYKWTVPMMLNLTGSQDDAGIAVGNSTSGKWTTISLKAGLLSIFHMSSPTLWHDTVNSWYFGYMYPLIFQIEVDATYIHYRWSNDGRNFIEVFKEPLTADFIGEPDRVAFYVDAEGNDFATGGTFCGSNFN